MWRMRRLPRRIHAAVAFRGSKSYHRCFMQHPDGFDYFRFPVAGAAGTAAAGQQSAQNIGNLMVGQGQARAAGQIGAANAFAQGASGITGAIGSGVQNYMLMNALQGGGGFGGLGVGAGEAPSATTPGTGQYGMVTSGLDVY